MTNSTLVDYMIDNLIEVASTLVEANQYSEILHDHIFDTHLTLMREVNPRHQQLLNAAHQLALINN